jgi:hypothetical protein
MTTDGHQTTRSRAEASYCGELYNMRSNSMTVDASTWITRFSEVLGVTPPTESEIETLLTLAGAAAHASERIAAPVSCWIAAKSSKSPEEALAAAEGLAGSLQ